MRFLSVCSGIDAASVAWSGLEWECAAFSEIERFPSAVLNSRFPKVRNLGDMNRYKDWDIGRSIDILVGGTPCQSFSVAGLRKGLDDPRGNLALVYCGLLERFKPKWFVWENVPGVLSSSGGRDFGSFLGAVAKLGYGFAYRVLDAQFFGVPQRRRRVFVVGCLGDWRRPAAVLFEPESMRRDTTKGKGKEQSIAKTLRGRANSSLREDSDNFLPVVSHACLAKGGSGRMDPSCETFIPTTARTLSARYDGSPCVDRGPEFIACTLPASNGGVSSGMHPVVAFSCKDYAADSGPLAPTLRSMGHDGSHANAGGQVAIAYQCHASNVGPMGTLRSGNGNESGGVPFLPTGVTIHGTDKTQKVMSYTDLAGSLRTKPPGSQENSSTTAVLQNMAVRRLTPAECEALQGFPRGWTAITYRGKPAADGPRYKAIGNSMAVPVMRWIGERINMQEWSN